MYGFSYIQIEDMVFYFVHRAIHHPLLYSTIHKVHHENKAVFGMSALYSSFTEFLLGNILPLTFAYLVCSHWSSRLVFVSLRMCLATDTHSGYNFPWSLDNLLDSLGLYSYAGSKFHNVHHVKYDCNYGSNFYLWDYLLGTSESWYDERKKGVQEEKRRSSGSTTSSGGKASVGASLPEHGISLRRRPIAG